MLCKKKKEFILGYDEMHNSSIKKIICNHFPVMCLPHLVSELREEEKKILEKCVFAQSVSMGSSVMVPVVASCVTFIAYVATGNNLTATQVRAFKCHTWFGFHFNRLKQPHRPSPHWLTSKD